METRITLLNTLQERALKSEEEISQLERTTLSLELEIVFHLSEDNLSDGQSRVNALYAVEAVIHQIVIDLNHAIDEAMAVVRTAGVQWSIDAQLFPWLPWPDRNVQVQLGRGYLPSVLDFSRPLTEQRIEGTQKLAAIALQPSVFFHLGSQLKEYLFPAAEPPRPFYSLELASVAVESLRFEHGSLKGIGKAVLAVLVVMAPLAATPVIQEKYDEYKIQKKIETQVAGQPCTLDVTWKHDLKTLREISLDAFNFNAPGLSPVERRERICNVQLALKLVQGSPDKIDGFWGPISQAALAHFAKQRGLPADIKSELLRGHLYQVFLNRENK